MSEHCDDGLADYYARRAAQYERIYARPERQGDLRELERRVTDLLAGRKVLEVACGTGYWTARVARRARSVLAADVNDEVLQIARRKPVPPGRVEFRRLDVYRTASLGRRFDGGLAAFWWSHVPRRRLRAFLDAFHAALLPGARVVFLDNRYVEGNSTPLARTDGHGDTWQRRSLDDGSVHEVRKNFPSGDELGTVLAPWADNLAVSELTYYWCAAYDLRASAGDRAAPLPDRR